MKKYPILSAIFIPISWFVKDIQGIENYPKKGPFIIASNQNSSPDGSIIVYSLMKKRKATGSPKMVGTLSIFRPYKDSFLNIFIVKLLEKALNLFFEVILVNQENPIQKAASALKKDMVILIFPEGKHNYDNPKLLKARTGAVRIALRAKVPIVPVGVIGTEKIIPKNCFIPRFRRMSLKIGKPMNLEEYFGMEDDFKTVNLLTKKLMQEIALLCGKKYID